MKPPYKIEPLGLTLEVVESEEYKIIERRAQDALTDDLVTKAYTHEAGHVVLFERMNEKVHPIGPVIRYDRKSELVYRFGGTWIPLLEKRYAIPYTVELLANIGMGLAAGGIFEERYLDLPESEWWDDGDESDFRECWHWATRLEKVPPRMFDTHWKEARDGVRSYLDKLTEEQKTRIERAKSEGSALYVPDLRRNSL
jgi:hypothetical protein